VRARWLCLAAVGLVVALGSSGCGAASVSSASNLGNQLTVYSSLPLQGPSGAISAQIVAGEKLALADAQGHVGSFKVSYTSMDDSNPKTGEWDPGETATDAKTAAQDSSTIAYLGDYNSAASAVSLPLINAAGILQVSPASPYVGLTSSLDAGQDEPDRFYPTGQRTFARLMPADPVQAAAQVQLMLKLHVHRVYVIDDQDPFEMPLAQIVASDAEHAGIKVSALDSLDLTATTEFKGEVSKVRASGAQAVFFSGGTEPGAVALWKQLYAADDQLLLLGTNSMVNPKFTAAVGAAGANTYLTTPALPVSLFPRAAAPVVRAYRKTFGEAPGAYALYGYETMSAVLAAIRHAGAQGNDRQTVIRSFFAIRDRDSVLGRYSIQASGDSTLTLYGADRVSAGQPVFYAALSGGGA
jgi:branched-chain amino acid transport system substrate-binding protein